MAVLSVKKLSELEGAKRIEADFYKPDYFIDFSKGFWRPIKEFLNICQYGISQAMTEEPKGYPIFRMDDIKDCFLLDDEVKYLKISEQVFKQYKLEENDVLFNRVNSEEFVGRTGIFKLKGNYVFASYLIRLRLKPVSEILPDYLNLFLNTKYGKKQIRRFSRRAVNQANVNAEELKNFKICIIPLKIQNQITQLSDEAWSKIELSKSLYSQAEALLLEEVGLKDFKLGYKKTYTAKLSFALSAHRIDAEYFQPSYEEVVELLMKKVKVEKLKNVVSFINHGKQPYYIENGDVPVLIQKHLGSQFMSLYSEIVNMPETPKTDEHFVNKYPEYLIKPFDVLFYSVGAYLGRTNVVLEDFKAVPASFITLIRTKQEICNPVYLALFLNSEIGQLQSSRWKSASAQQYIYPKEIKEFLIPILPLPTQQKIASLVQQSHEARRKAKELLEVAKKAVEIAIEKDEKEALCYISKTAYGEFNE
ncbi:restriction endonuclease subunit S [Thermoflavifilum thermophilum]|uniref:Type I restriction enzyme, S subunit n=1 Tax=Thermoflavifilum thermophilum TaxID=1393122 RepID=A0A1I7NN72_9BACT|nr:restriction endonuclease subunit S [Thermoflavifilum thermophilum]SFV36101.1 type I restriction enzyme, S subunit [Thermoflavifilum thermophilum]